LCSPCKAYWALPQRHSDPGLCREAEDPRAEILQRCNSVSLRSGNAHGTCPQYYAVPYRREPRKNGSGRQAPLQTMSQGHITDQDSVAASRRRIQGLSNTWLRASVLGANWAASEIILGSFLHNLHIPFKGSLLTA